MKVFALKFTHILEVLCKVYKKSYGRIITIYAPKNEAVSYEIQTHFGSSLPARFTEKAQRSFTIYTSKNEAVAKFRRILEVFALRGL